MVLFQVILHPGYVFKTCRLLRVACIAFAVMGTQILIAPSGTSSVKWQFGLSMLGYSMLHSHCYFSFSFCMIICTCILIKYRYIPLFKNFRLYNVESRLFWKLQRFLWIGWEIGYKGVPWKIYASDYTKALHSKSES